MPDEPVIVPISGLENELTTPDNNDWLVIEDVSEPIEANKIKKIKKSNLSPALQPILEAIYFVGIIIETGVSTNPAAILGFGTWSLYGVGRTTVCVDTTQSEFDTIGKESGSKTVTLTTSEMPSHTHTQDAHNHLLPLREFWRWQAWTGGSSEYGYAYNGYGHSSLNATATNQNTGGGQPHNNLQPSVVVYRWIRTA